MGYCSDVALCVSDKVSIPDNVQKDMNQLGFHQVAQYKGCKLFILYSVKWYPESSWIHYISDFIDSLEDEEYRFLRIGEDMDDTESRGGFYGNPFNLGIERQFCYDELDDTL